MEKKFMYVEDLEQYGVECVEKFMDGMGDSLNFIEISRNVRMLVNVRTGKNAVAVRSEKDRDNMYIAFAYCWNRYHGLPDPKELKLKKIHFYELKNGDVFYYGIAATQPYKCLGMNFMNQFICSDKTGRRETYTPSDIFIYKVID